MLKRTIVALALSLLAQPAGAQGLVMVRDISYDMALVMAQTALEHCRKLGFKIGVSVVDRGGHVLVTLRDHGAAHHTVEVTDPKEVKQVQEYISRNYQTAKAVAEKDETQTHLKGKADGLLIYQLKLQRQ